MIEDTDWTPEDLRADGANDKILAALESVTRRDDETYTTFIDRADRTEIGRAVKIADLVDNLDLSRIKEPTQADVDRLDRYREALQRPGAERPGATAG